MFVLLFALSVYQPETEAELRAQIKALEARLVRVTETKAAEVWAPSTMQRQMYDHAMKLRAGRGLARQAISENCMKMAQDHAEFMATQWGHNHGKNDQIIATGYGDYNGAFRGWTGSPPHAAWLYGSSDCVGFGYAVSANGTPYYCGVYRDGAPESVAYSEPGGYSTGYTYGYTTGRRRWLRPWRRR